ncbi:MAG TPA: mannitol dehydrogenase family protein [Sphingomonas sp.]|jgi:tagaturonate reductase|uniref:mannitol dehydrogenase family protein n=1 Tax=Sphingomonas sp. TaxID=28214 RepID=UPI002ED91EE5
MILQFGTSRFLQAHVDLFAQEAADAGQTVPPILIVQTTGDAARAARLRGFADPAGFPVILRGIAAGETVDRTVQVRSVVNGLSIAADRDAVTAAFVETVTHVVSNTGDTGYAIADDDRAITILTGGASRSFPAMLLALLHHRWRAGRPGVTILPCELVQRNGAMLRALLTGLATDIGAEAGFILWLERDCVWTNTLVDRIVSTPIEPAGAIAEPYALWAIERQPGLTLPFTHPAIVLADDLEPHERLKLHILNLGHSWLAERWHAAGADPDMTVRAMLADAETLAALRRLYAEEVVPGFAAHGLEQEARAYVDGTLDRFANPFLDHRVADIYGNHAAKIDTRVGGFVRWVAGADVPVPVPMLRALARAYPAAAGHPA